MDNWEKIKAAQHMQDYIEAHIDESMTLEEIGAAAGYSLNGMPCDYSRG